MVFALMSHALQTTGALVCFYLFGSAFIKLSMLYFYRRIFVGRAFNICTLGLIGFTIVWLVYAILAWLLYCGPNLQANFEGGWAVCPSYGFAIQIGTFVADSIIDLALLILPIPFVSPTSPSNMQSLRTRLTHAADTEAAIEPYT